MKIRLNPLRHSHSEAAPKNLFQNNPRSFDSLRLLRMTSLGLIFIILILANPANTAEIQKLDSGGKAKKIEIKGFCGGAQVAVRLYREDSDTPIYSAGRECANGEFNFKDDLEYWRIPSGIYKVSVSDEDGSTEETLLIGGAENSAPVEQAQTNTATATNEAFEVEINAASPEGSEVIGEPQETAGFWARIFRAIVDWLQDAIVRIKEIVAEKITTPKLCLGETCIMESQLKELLKSDLSSGGVQTNTAPETGPGAASAEQAETEPPPAPPAAPSSAVPDAEPNPPVASEPGPPPEQAETEPPPAPAPESTPAPEASPAPQETTQSPNN